VALTRRSAETDATAAYLKGEDAMGAWVEECCVPDVDKDDGAVRLLAKLGGGGSRVYRLEQAVCAGAGGPRVPLPEAESRDCACESRRRKMRGGASRRCPSNQNRTGSPRADARSPSKEEDSHHGIPFVGRTSTGAQARHLQRQKTCACQATTPIFTYMP
jgi:hypothetical protein